MQSPFEQLLSLANRIENGDERFVLLFPQVDIFSFAIFLFELFSGCRPFRDYRNPGDIKKVKHAAN